MANLLTWTASITIIGYTGITALLYISQRHLLFFPVPENQYVTEESVRWESGNETIKLWRIGDGKNALIYFGGNAEDVAGNIPQFRQFFPEHSIFLVNYRGYGGSTGSPTQVGLYEDALEVYDRVRKAHEHISVIGRSLGSAVAAHLAASREVSKLVLVTPFDSVLNTAKDIYPVFPVSLLLKDRFDTASVIDEIQTPILVLVAERDGVIPRKRTDALIHAIPEDQVSVRIIRETNHNDIQESADYAQTLISFIGN